MRRLLASGLTLILAVTALGVACSPAAPPPPPTAAPTKAPVAAPAAPTAAPVVPTKAPEPTKIPYPEKGKTITVIIPMAAGGGTDISARSILGVMEKDLGVPIQIINKPGASTQLGLTDLAAAKPDGYTLGVVNLPTGLITYLDQSRKATYTKKSFQPIGMISADPIGFNVKGDSPFKTLKDMVDAAKAKPESVKGSTTGIGSVTHLAGLALEKETGIRLSYVHFDSTPLSLTAMMGGHVDTMISGISGLWSQYKSGEARQLAVLTKTPNELTPEIPTAESQGFKVYAESNYGIIAPTGVSKDVIDRLAESFKKGMADPSVKQKLFDLGQTPRGLDAAAYDKAWSDMEEWTSSLMGALR